MSSHDYGVENFTLNNNICNVSIREDVLQINFLTEENSNKIIDSKPPRIIPFSEILSVQFIPQENETEKRKVGINFKKKLKLPNIRIQTVKKYKDCKWKLVIVKLKSSNEEFCRYWADNFSKKLSEFSDSRPKSLLVFINPYGGNGEGVNIYEKKVKPIFEEANVKTEIINTDFRHHAKTYIETKDLSTYDGIVAVGGDGMCNEIINGLLCRTQTRHGVNLHAEKGNPRKCPDYIRPEMRIGVIPAGSTDCVSYVTQGINDAETSALHIVLGDSHPLDVVSLHNSDGMFTQFSMSLNGYGYFGDIMRQSEHLRWMGPPRYSLAGANVFLRNKSYPGEVHYVPADCKEGPKSSSFCRAPCGVCQDGLADVDSSLFTPVTPNSSFTGTENQGLGFKFDDKIVTPDQSTDNEIIANDDATEKEVGKNDEHLREKMTHGLSYANKFLDSGIQEDISETKQHINTTANIAENSGNKKNEILVDGLNDDNADSLKFEEQYEPEHANYADNDVFMTEQLNCDVITSFCARPTSLELNLSAVNKDKEKWKVIKGDFMAVNGVSMSCACERSPLGLSPYSHLSDGALDLIIVRSCSRFDFLRYLAVHTGRGDRFDFPFIEVHRVKAFQFIPSIATIPTVIESPYSSPESPHEVGSGGESIHISLEDLSVRYDRQSGKKKRKKRREMKRTQSEVVNTHSSWNSDGEIVKDPNMTVRVHRGLILMFCRGIEEPA